MASLGPTEALLDAQRIEVEQLLQGEQLSAELLSLMDNIDPNDFTAREQALDTLNNQLISFSLETSTPQRLDISNCGATRASSALFAFLEKHSASLESIVLANNAFTSLAWLKNYSFPKLNILDISNNRLSSKELDELQTDYFMIMLFTRQSPIVVLPAARTQKPLTKQFKNHQLVPDPTDSTANETHHGHGIFKGVKKLFKS